MNNAKYILFVYGTLKKNERAHEKYFKIRGFLLSKIRVNKIVYLRLN